MAAALAGASTSGRWVCGCGRAHSCGCGCVAAVEVAMAVNVDAGGTAFGVVARAGGQDRLRQQQHNIE